MQNILLFGGGLHVHYCIDNIEKEGKYRVAGITDPYKTPGSELYGYRVLGRQEELLRLIREHDLYGGLITIGDNWERKHAYDAIHTIKPDFVFVNTIHPSALIGRDVELGVGNLIMAGAIINPGARIGNFCFVATGAQVEHDNVMHDFSSISAGSITGGKVEIGKYSAITLGVTIADRLKIGENTVIGSGSLVLDDVPDNVLAYGSPAKVVRSRKPGERFLKSG
ncbi:MAG TPA: NeuD/PglB/VioB family sugar acetyltransferase [Candidatus Acidoferrum sp.]|nr:NeuD/PglB/VioB family sugar acetyltransferase [Candidatus Acidoferrum sp.]